MISTFCDNKHEASKLPTSYYTLIVYETILIGNNKTCDNLIATLDGRTHHQEEASMVSIHTSRGLAFALAWQSRHCGPNCATFFSRAPFSNGGGSFSIMMTTRWASGDGKSVSSSKNQNEGPIVPPLQPIVAYHLDEEQHCVAELEYGHNQHVRHDPPMVERPWVLTTEGRDSFLGYQLPCLKCARGEPKDEQ